MPSHILKNGAGLLKHALKHGDEVVQSATTKVAKKAAKKPPRPAPNELRKADYQSNKLNKYGETPRDFAVLGDQSAGLPKPQFLGKDGKLYYHQFNGKDKKTGKDRLSSFRKVDLKKEEVLKRDKVAKLQTKREVRGSFYQDRPQVVDINSHHITPIKALRFLFDGLDEFEARDLINHFEKKGVYIGNDPRNAKHLSKPDHDSVHNEYAKRAILKYNHASLKGTALADRFQFADVLIDEIKEANEIVAKFNSPAMTPQEFIESHDRLVQPELANNV